MSKRRTPGLFSTPVTPVTHTRRRNSEQHETEREISASPDDPAETPETPETPETRHPTGESDTQAGPSMSSTPNPKRKNVDRRRKDGPCLKYFRRDVERKLLICTVELEDDVNDDGRIGVGRMECGREIKYDENTHSGTRLGNLKRHLARYHKETYGLVCAAEEKQHKQKVAERQRLGSGQTILGNYFHTKITSLCIKMTREEFKKGLVSMVCCQSVPFRFFEGPGFKVVCGTMAEKLNVSLSRDRIRDYVMAIGRIERTKLSMDLKGKPLYVKLDCATRLRTNYLGINIQYYDEERNEAVIKTLCVRDTYSAHSSHYLRRMTVKVLEDFNIDTKNVLAVVTDNASNMVKMVEDMNTGEEEEDSDSEPADDDEDEFEDDYNADELDDNVANMGNDFLSLSLDDGEADDISISHMRCAAHTLALAVKDGIEERQTSRVIAKVRDMVKTLRSPKINEKLKKRAKLTAIVDVETRWGSTYLMLKRIVQLEEHIKEIADLGNRELALRDHQWEEIHGLADVLKKPYECTVKFQYATITPGYFFRKWTGLKGILASNGGQLALEMLSSMEKREDKLMNPLVFGAVLADVFHSALLSDEQVSKGKEVIIKLAMRLLGLEDDSHASDSHVVEDPVEDPDSDEEMSRTRSPCSQSIVHATSYFYGSEAQTSHSQSLSRSASRASSLGGSGNEEDNSTSRRKIEDAIHTIIQKREEYARGRKAGERVPIQAVIKDRYPEIIKDVCLILSCLPVTQVSVERLFSSLKLLKSDLRSRLKDDILENMLFLRCNGAL